MAIEYGTIAVVPKGEWDSSAQYEVANLVTLDGSSYLAHTKPPVGTLPTNTAYWQVSAQGTSKATADSVGTVKPDGTTIGVTSDGTLSVKTATQSALGLVKGSSGIKVAADGNVDLNTAFTQATELANIIAGEAIASVLGKISKSIAVTMGLNENALLKNMLTNMDANDSAKVPTSAFIHTLVERIGMGEDLEIGDNLTAGLNALNSNLGVNITLSDTGIFHITNQVVIEYPSYYAISITIIPTVAPTSDTPMLTFNKNLKSCTLFITNRVGAVAVVYANPYNQMLYRLISGAINTAEITVNGIVPKAIV